MTVKGNTSPPLIFSLAVSQRSITDLISSATCPLISRPLHHSPSNFKISLPLSSRCENPRRLPQRAKAESQLQLPSKEACKLSINNLSFSLFPPIDFGSMKGVMKGKMMKKLKSIKPGDYLKPDRILQVSNFDEFVDNFAVKSNLKFPLFKDRDPNRRASCKVAVPPDPFQHVDMDELARQLEDEANEEEKLGLGFHSRDSSKEDAEDKENIRPSINTIPDHIDLSDPSDFDISSFRRPDLDSATLFDPKLLSAFHHAVIEYLKKEEEDQLKAQKSGKPTKPETDDLTEEEDTIPLSNFQEKCPPGGSYAVILYTTSLRGIRKTFEDCHSVRFLLESFRVIFQERDISIHSEFREEMWSTLGEKSLPPRLFIMGRYIGGAEEVLSLHEQGRLKNLFEGVPRNQRDCPCQGCGGFRFVVCFRCDGSTRVDDEDDEEGDNGGFLSRIRCPECNENGLIVCPYCC